MDIITVATTEDFKLLLHYANGEQRLFDMRPLLSERPWDRLLAEQTFAQASVAYGTVVWPGRIDLAPETLYLDSVQISHSQVASLR